MRNAAYDATRVFRGEDGFCRERVTNSPSLKARGARHRAPKPTRRGAFWADFSANNSNGS